MQNILDKLTKDEMSMNYEQLKNYLKAEDFIYENLILPAVLAMGFNVRFKGSNIIFSKI